MEKFWDSLEKKARYIMGKKYNAFSKVLIINTKVINIESVVLLDLNTSSKINSLLQKVGAGGTPIIDNAPMVNADIVIGMLRPIPCILSAYFSPVFVTIIPTTKNKVIFASAWHTNWKTAIFAPNSVNIETNNMIYESWEIVE